MELDEILNGQTPEESPVSDAPEAQAPEPEATPSIVRDEAGRFAPKGEQTPAITPEAAPPAAETDQNRGLAAALAEERRKRQEFERRLADFEARQTPTPQRPAESEYIPNPVDDPQGFYDAVMKQAREEARAELTPLISQQVGQTRTEMLRLQAATKYPDFAETEAEYRKLVEANPALKQEVSRAENPVEKAYQLTKNLLEVRKAGSTDIAAIKAAAIAEYVAAQTPAAAPQDIPTSLADAQSSRAAAAGFGGPPTLDQILGR